MLSESVSFHIPERPYSPIDALNRRAAAMGSVVYAMAAAHADYNGHHTTLRWNEYRGYYIAEYFWAGRCVLARGSFVECLSAVLYEQNKGKLGSSAAVYPRADDAEAIAVCEETDLLEKGDGWKDEGGSKSLARDSWWTWQHDCASAAARDAANPGSLVMHFDWDLMKASADRASYEAALIEKHGSVYVGGFDRRVKPVSEPAAIPEPPKAKAPARYCYRCEDCLFVSFTEEPVKESAESAGCGGKIEAMGRVVRKRLTVTETLCACDGRCTSATGPSCDCSCGGANHGSGAVVRVIRDAGAVPSLTARDSDAQYAAAAAYRAAIKAAQTRMEIEYGSLLEDYKQGKRIASYETWSDIKRDYETIRKARALRSRGGRIKALAKVCPADRSDDTSGVTTV